MTHKARELFLLLLVIAAGAEFSLRGPIRAARSSSEWNDFLSPYIQARAWTRGMNPYSTDNFLLLWPSNKVRLGFVVEGAANGTLVANRGVPSPYPLTSFVMLAPLALLPWSIAQGGWITINLAAFMLMLSALLSLAGVGWRDPRGQLFLALGLALAPFHTGLATENAAVLVVALCGIAVWAEKQGHHKTAGILLGIAVCLKPQIGLCFVLYYLIRRRWRAAGIASGWTVVVGAIAILRLAVSGTPWLSSYFEINQKTFAPGAINDFTTANPVWYHLINLQVVFSALGSGVRLANALALLCGALLFGAWLWLVMKRQPGSGLLEISSLAVLSMLPIYHRFYDAGLLIWPLCWSLLVVKEQCRRVAWIALAFMLPFLVPGAAFLNQVAESGRIRVGITGGWWWNALVAHEVWLLLGLGLLLLYAMKPACHTHRMASWGTGQ